MKNVVGIGGVFFRAKDPEALAAWYETHLGINRAPTDMVAEPWFTEAGVTVFAPFAQDTDYFARDKQFMLNFRVSDMDEILTHFRSIGVAVTNEVSQEGLGRFAHIHDPEGNPIELWEPIPG